MGQILSHPVTSKNVQRFGDQRMRVGVAEMQGYRTNMEDAHTVQLQLKSHPLITYIGMFDGHNGAAAAEFMAREMPARLDALPNPADRSAFCAAVEKADADFMSDAQLREHGSTACMVLISNENGKRKLTVANVGDSRCLVIGTDGSVKFTTVDHKPDTESEAARIRAAGGSVSMGRVNGDLAMSRSIGDSVYKNVDHLGPLVQKVIPTPDVSEVDLLPTDIVLVCCDGLVERLTNEQVATHIMEQLAAQRTSGKSDSDLDPAVVMQSLLEFSLRRGSKDNMSAALILPIDGSSYGRADEYCVGPFSEWADDRAFADAFIGDAKKHGYTRDALMQMVNQYNAQKADKKENSTIDK